MLCGSPTRNAGAIAAALAALAVFFSRQYTTTKQAIYPAANTAMSGCIAAVNKIHAAQRTYLRSQKHAVASTAAGVENDRGLRSGPSTNSAVPATGSASSPAIKPTAHQAPEPSPKHN